MVKTLYELKVTEFLEYLESLNVSSESFTVLRSKNFTSNGVYLLAKKISRLTGLDEDKIFCYLIDRCFNKYYKYT